jgi:hypothetical protein
MGIINNQGVFIAPPSGSGDLTSFREDDDFSTELFDDPIVQASLPNNVGIAFIKSSDSPADFATISLKEDNTSTIYVDNTVSICSFVVSNDVFVGYTTGVTSIPVANGVNGNLYVNKDITANEVTANEVTANEVTASGITLTSRKAFDIQHPNKPGWRLRHICLEGPESAVYFRGRLTGHNIIELPSYWKGFVDPESITVSLTQIGSSQDLIVERIEWGSKIVIRSGTATNIDCYYLVHGTRMDGENLIVEYEGNQYPGDNSQYSINK